MSAATRFVRLFVLVLAALAFSSRQAWCEDAEAAKARLAESVKYLASDELEGRGPGTRGLTLAAEYIADRFSKLGLKTDVFSGQVFQPFPVALDAELGPADENHLTWIGPPSEGAAEPQRITFELGKTANPLALGGTAKFDLPLVFAGYGITAPDANYDDFAGLDVQGKAVVLIRKEPQQDNPHSVFDGANASRHARFNVKVSNAFQHGATTVILVNDAAGLNSAADAANRRFDEILKGLTEARQMLAKAEPNSADAAELRKQIKRFVERLQATQEELEGGFDEVLPLTGAGDESSHRDLPVFFVSRAAIDPAVKAATGKSLLELEQAIDHDLKPLSTPLAGWRAVGQSHIIHKQTEARNVAAVLPGSGELAEQVVIVGAHFDHLGNGGAGSLAPWTREIHNGADDNASGTAALLEVAAQLSGQTADAPRRTILFLAFAGEEKGLLGSAFYIKNPALPLDRVTVMVNMDMVGRLNENKLIVSGSGTAEEFDALIDQTNERYQFEIKKDPGGNGPSDHQTFYTQKIPVLHFFTGTHNDYHRPSDDFDKLNVDGMSRIVAMVGDVTRQLATRSAPLHFREVRSSMADRGGDRPYFGSIPDFGNPIPGYALMGTAKDSPAERAGLQAGDVITAVGDNKIAGLEDFDGALRKFKADDEVEVTAIREGKEIKLRVTLDKPR